MPIFYKILHNENSLDIFESLLEVHRSITSLKNLKIGVNLQSLSLKINHFTSFFSLLDYTPNLKNLKILLIVLLVNNQSNPNKNSSQIKLRKFSFTLQSDGIDQRNFLFLTRFIKQFSSSFISLSLNFNQIHTQEFTFNGFTLLWTIKII
jgi:hypothetical protein